MPTTVPKPTHKPLTLTLGVDGLPILEPLCELQAAIAQAYSDVLANLTQQHAELSGLRAQALGLILERFRYDAPWAVTEVRRSPEFKIRRQRYISEAVFDRWQAVARLPRPTLGAFTKDASGQTLRHDHVVQRKGLGLSLQGLGMSDALRQLLTTAVACVVTKDEHTRLSVKSEVDGWDRYHRLESRIGVYDRLERRWLIERG